MIVGRVVLGVLTDIKHGARSIIPIFVLVFFTVIGALIFMAIEGPNEKYEMEQLKLYREKLLEV